MFVRITYDVEEKTQIKRETILDGWARFTCFGGHVILRDDSFLRLCRCVFLVCMQSLFGCDITRGPM